MSYISLRQTVNMIAINFHLRWWIMYSAMGASPESVNKILNVMSRGLTPCIVNAITWALALSLALPPIFGWSYYTPESGGIRYTRINMKRKQFIPKYIISYHFVLYLDKHDNKTLNLKLTHYLLQLCPGME